LFIAALFHPPFESHEAIHSFWYDSLGLVPADSPWFCWFTSFFVHAGWLHLIGNMIYLFLFGSLVEDMMGRGQLLIFYLLGGLAADLVHIAFTPGHFASATMLVGASGAISACMGAFAVVMFRSSIEFKWLFFFSFRLFNGEFHSPTSLVMSFWF
jgi:membrane associated rhomboid family serine protease